MKRLSSTMLLLLFATVAVADQCGDGQRVDPPPCVVTTHVKSYGIWRVRNNCDWKVVLKVDVAHAGDEMLTLWTAQEQSVYEPGFPPWAHIRAIKCCKEMGRCE